jgi:hypothetical protein
MTLIVNRQWDLPGWPAIVHQPPAGITPVISTLGTSAQVRIAWSAGDSAVHARNEDGTPMVPGAPDDVVFRAPGPLRPVAVVPREFAYGGPFLAAALDSGTSLYLIRIAANGAVASVETVPQPSGVSAGPSTGRFPPNFGLSTSDNSLPPPVYTGLADGTVICNVFGGTPGAETVTPVPVRHLSGRITGLTALGDAFVAASLHGDLADNTGEWLGTLTNGHEWQPLAYAVDPTPGAGDGVDVYYALVDRTVGALATWNTKTAGPLSYGQNRALGEPVNAPAIEDIDADGLPEFLFTTRSGRVGWWNDNGSLSPGWPPRLESEGFPTYAGPLPLVGPGGGIVLASLGNGVLTAVNAADGKRVSGFPLGLSVHARGTGAIDYGSLVPEATPRLFVADGDTLLRGIRLEFAVPGTIGSSTWRHEGGTSGRAYVVDRVFRTATAIADAGSTILPGTFKCYPNPARQSPVTFAFRLNAPESVTIRIFDPAAREVGSITRDAGASDNAIVWDPGDRPSGLYVARVQAGSQVMTQPFVLIR